MAQSVRSVAILGDGDDPVRGGDDPMRDGDASGRGGDTSSRDADTSSRDEAADRTRDLRAAVEANDGRLAGADDADAIVALGERALADAAERGRSAPLLPVGSGRFAVPRPSAADAIRRLLSGGVHARDHPLLSVTVGDDAPIGRALFDVTLTTAEPARISEYGVSFPGERTSTFRGDAVVVATPLGSGGYAGAAGGPLLEPGTGLSVVPVAPFATRREAWVVPERVTLSVEREHESVSLVLDDRSCGTVPPNEPIRVAETDRVELLSVPPTEADE